MKICFITGAFPKMKCGIGDYCNKIAIELAKNNHEVSVITSTKANTQNDEVKVFNIIEKWDHNACKTIIEKLKQINPDVVNIQYPNDEYNNSIAINLLPGMIKRKIGCKVTQTIHEYECFTLKRKIRNYFNFKNLDKVIVVEDYFIDLIKKDFKNVDITYIPISSNIPRSTLTEKERLVDKLNLKGKKIISYFGFANHLKGIENLLKCLSHLDNVQLLFIGDLDKNNEYHNQLIDLIEKLDIKDKVTITGFLENATDVADYLSVSDVCVLPFINGVKSRNGSFLAAYNQKIPVITTNSKLIESNNGIYYVSPNNEQELLNKIEYVLSHKQDFTREELTWKEVARQYLEYLK